MTRSCSSWRCPAWVPWLGPCPRTTWSPTMWPWSRSSPPWTRRETLTRSLQTPASRDWNTHSTLSHYDCIVVAQFQLDNFIWENIKYCYMSMHIYINIKVIQITIWHWFDFLFVSVSVPEKLDYFINRYAEHLHEKWSMDKVMENTIPPATTE